MWAHCAVARGDLDRAMQEAVETIAEWSGYGAKCRTIVTFSSGLSDELERPDAITNLHRGDLAEVSQLRIVISSDRDAFWDTTRRLREEYQEARLARREGGDLDAANAPYEPPEPDPLVEASVSISL